jgi:uncharacterized membrane protein YidH (DUF202 family)
MKLYRLAFLTMVVLLGKFFFGFKYVTGNGPEGNAGMLWILLGGALLSFVIGGIAYSFEIDRQEGRHATRNAIGILAVLNLPLIVSFIAGLVLTLMYHKW